jgi:hypothetical protein
VEVVAAGRGLPSGEEAAADPSGEEADVGVEEAAANAGIEAQVAGIEASSLRERERDE